MSQTTVAPGATVTLNYTIHNGGSAEGTGYGIYISTNSTISTSDRLLTNGVTLTDIAQNGSITASITFSIPSDLAPNTYWLGVVADHAEAVAESNETNNASTGIAITVQGGDPGGGAKPDFAAAITAVSGSSGEIRAGYAIDVSKTLYNLGTAAGNATYAYYISTDSKITTGDRLLTWVSPLDTIAAGGSRSGTTSHILPSDLAPGSYYLGIVTDFQNQVAESNETNNDSPGFAFTVVGPKPDLTDVVTDVEAAGNALLVRHTVSNPGAGVAPAHKVGVYLSRDTTISSTDTFLGEYNHEALGGAQSRHWVSTTLPLPANLTPGTYYVGAIPDHGDTIAESNESNNASNAFRVILGNAAANTLSGTSSDDVMLGLAGNDSPFGGSGADKLYGGDGDDRLTGDSGNDLLDGGSGHDHLWSDGRDTIDGGDAFDFAYFSVASDLTVALSGSTAARIKLNGTNAGTIKNVQGIWSGSGDDTITGDDLATNVYGNDGNDRIDGRGSYDHLYGGKGNDLIVGGGSRAENDVLYGEDGTDRLIGGGGSDSIDGGLGADTASYSNASGRVSVNLATGRASGADGNDTLKSIENVEGSRFGDTLIGNTADNDLYGRAGADRLTGGTGRDSFTFRSLSEGGDTITDFNARYDSIKLIGIAADPDDVRFVLGTRTTSLNDSVIYNRSTGQLWWDDNGRSAGGLTLLATLSNKTTLTEADIVFG